MQRFWLNPDLAGPLGMVTGLIVTEMALLAIIITHSDFLTMVSCTLSLVSYTVAVLWGISWMRPCLIADQSRLLLRRVSCGGLHNLVL
jgi:hypothetical protein